MHALLPTLRPSRAARRLAVQLALFALLVAALVPTVSRLLQPVGSAGWAVLCQSPTSGGAPDGQSTPGDDACALCTLGHTTPMLGAAAPPPMSLLAYAPPAPPAPAAVRTRVVQWRAPGARAPPILA